MRWGARFAAHRAFLPPAGVRGSAPAHVCEYPSENPAGQPLFCGPALRHSSVRLRARHGYAKQAGGVAEFFYAVGAAPSHKWTFLQFGTMPQKDRHKENAPRGLWRPAEAAPFLPFALRPPAPRGDTCTPARRCGTGRPSARPQCSRRGAP